MVVTDTTHRVTGALTPDVTGDYRPIGLHNGKMSYELEGNGWFIWWNGINTWIISTEVGLEHDDWWERVNALVVGAYNPLGGAIGIATVAEI